MLNLKSKHGKGGTKRYTFNIIVLITFFWIFNSFQLLLFYNLVDTLPEHLKFRRPSIASFVNYDAKKITPTSIPLYLNKTSTRNLTLVVIIGTLRCGEPAWQSLFHNVLDINQADLAVITQEPEPFYKNASILRRAKYVFTVPSYSDWADALDLIHNESTWRTKIYQFYQDDGQPGVLGGALNFSGSGAIIFWYRWYLAEIIKKEKLIDSYQTFVITRSDHYYLCPHYVSHDWLNPYYLWTPRGESYGGVTDRHLVVDRANVLPALDILPPFLADPSQYQNFLQEKLSNTEKFLKHRFKQMGLYPARRNRFPRVMFTCMAPHEGNGSWKPLGSRVREGVHLRYPREYKLSRKSCKLSDEKRRWYTEEVERLRKE